MKVDTHIRIDVDVAIELKKNGVNISQVCRDYLRTYVGLDKQDHEKESLAELKQQEMKAQVALSKVKTELDKRKKADDERFKHLRFVK